MYCDMYRIVTLYRDMYRDSCIVICIVLSGSWQHSPSSDPQSLRAGRENPSASLQEVVDLIGTYIHTLTFLLNI